MNTVLIVMPTMPESYRMGVGLLERLTPGAGAGETDPFREVPIRYLGENILLYCLIIFTSTVRAYRQL